VNEWKKSHPDLAPTFVNARAYQVVTMLAEALRKISGKVTRESLRSSLEANFKNYQGPYTVVTFTTSNHNGADPKSLEWATYQGNGVYGLYGPWAKDHVKP
jgi:hypothetical protein